MLILMLEMCTVNSHSQGTCVLLEIPSMHKLIQYFQSLYTCRNEDIYELKGVHIANIEDDLCSSSVEFRKHRIWVVGRCRGSWGVGVGKCRG